MFDKILKEICEENEYEIREYSGRSFAKDLMGIVIPNGMRSFGMFVHELTLKVSTNALELQGEDKDSEAREMYELLENFIQTLEFDSMGRDEQVLYSREFKWADYQNAIGEEEED